MLVLEGVRFLMSEVPLKERKVRSIGEEGRLQNEVLWRPEVPRA